jgi:hypothetical protein
VERISFSFGGKSWASFHLRDSRSVMENIKKDLNDILAGHVRYPLKKKYVVRNQDVS